MKENLPKEQCGMLKFYICFSFFFLLVFSFSFPLCFLNNAYWMLFSVLAAFVVDCFVFFLFVQRKWWLKIVKDMLETSQSVDLKLHRSLLLLKDVKGRKGWLCLYLSTPTQQRLFSPLKTVKSLVANITQDFNSSQLLHAWYLSHSLILLII